jgi:hypothetical protein
MVLLDNEIFKLYKFLTKIHECTGSDCKKIGLPKTKYQVTKRIKETT